MKKVFLSVLFAVLMLATTIFSSCGSKADYIVGYDNKFPPMGFKDLTTGKDIGFDLDLAKAVFEELGYTVEFKAIDWSLKEKELNSKSIDLIWNGYTITDARKEIVNFSIPYMKNTQCVVVLANSTISSVDDISLQNDKIVVQQGSSAMEAIAGSEKLAGFVNTTTLEDGKKDYTVVEGKTLVVPDNVTALNSLNTQETSVFVTDFVLASYLINSVEANKGKFKILGEYLADEEYGIGVRKEDTELLKKINDTLIKFHKDGTLKKIADNWELSEALIVANYID